MFVKVGVKKYNRLGKCEIREIRFYNAREVKTTYGITEIDYVDEEKGLTNECYKNNNIAYVVSYTDVIGMKDLIKGGKND